MREFRDNEGRPWRLSVNVATVKQVKELLGVNILELCDQKADLLERIIDDPCLLCDVLFAIVKQDADAKQITDSEFGRSLGGDVLEAAADALLAEVSDFFPTGRREILKRILAKVKEVQGKAENLALVRLADPRIDAMIDKEIAEAMDRACPLPNSATGDVLNSQALPASTPGNTPSGN